MDESMNVDNNIDNSNISGGSNNRELMTFFGRDKVISRTSSIDAVEFRSRSISSVSNGSYSGARVKYGWNQKYFNLAALDGFAMIENDEEEKLKITETVLKGMDVEGIWEENFDNQNKTFHLDKLFNDKGPYFTQNTKSNNTKRNRIKRNRKRSIHYQRNFLDRIDDSLLRNDSDDVKNYGTEALFEDPEEKAIRIAKFTNKSKQRKSQNDHKRVKASNSPVMNPFAHLPFSKSHTKNAWVQTEPNIASAEILNKADAGHIFKDQEILSAFKLAILHIETNNRSATSDEFYDNLGKSFISFLRNKPALSEDGLTNRLDNMNIQSECTFEPSVISDFGDIIPVNYDETYTSAPRKHKKWTIGEYKKLTSLLDSRSMNDISDWEWSDIASKLDRSKTSVYYKAKEYFKKPMNPNKKRKVTENPVWNFNDASSNGSVLKQERGSSVNIHQMDTDIIADEPAIRETNPGCLFLTRKKAIESVLEAMPDRWGSKSNIFKAISQKYNIDLNDNSSQQYKGFQQCLWKYFRNEKGYYALITGTTEYEAMNSQLKSINVCNSWKEKTFFILNQFPHKRAKIDEIKISIEYQLSLSSSDMSKSLDSNLATWEKNVLKTLSKHDSIFDSSNAKSVYYAN